MAAFDATEGNMAQMAATAMIHVRVDEEVKAQATEALAAMGLSVSDAVRVFLKRVAAEKALPFELRVRPAMSAPRSRRTFVKIHAFSSCCSLAPR